MLLWLAAARAAYVARLGGDLLLSEQARRDLLQPDLQTYSGVRAIRRSAEQGAGQSPALGRWRRDWPARRAALARQIEAAPAAVQLLATIDFSASPEYTRDAARRALQRFRGLERSGELQSAGASTARWSGPRRYAAPVMDALWNSGRFLRFEVYTQPRVHGRTNEPPRANFDAEAELFGGAAPAEFAGSGAVVAVADTGVDLTHCYHAARSQGCTPIGAPAAATNALHVLRYAGTDCGDADGHGTHVMGSVLTLAPAARGVMVDAQPESQAGQTLSFEVGSLFASS